MTFLEKIQVIERVDQLISMTATGSPSGLAARLGISKRCVFDLINLMKSMGAPIKYNSLKSSFYYQYPCDLMIGFVEQKKFPMDQSSGNKIESVMNNSS